MRRSLVMGPMLVVSLAFFLAAALLARTDAQAILLALAGACAPALGLLALALRSMAGWHAMARELGLVARGTGPFPDLEGRYRGRRLVVRRRTNHYGVGPRLTTAVRLEGFAEVQLPGTVTAAATVQQIVAPLMGANADEEL